MEWKRELIRRKVVGFVLENLILEKRMIHVWFFLSIHHNKAVYDNVRTNGEDHT